MTGKGSLRNILLAAGFISTLWLLGLELFVAHIASLHEPASEPELEATDAIVTLTGGSERVPAGVALLEAGKGKMLLISGVHPGLTLDRLLGPEAVPKELRGCCIILGHAAESTMGNAEETLRWMQNQNYHSLRLVTANYHMPRSLMIFHAAMPDIKIIPHPVMPDGLQLSGWWLHPHTTNLLVVEYNKYIVAAVRNALGL
jgi:uncharacterized SAM-binding protein YcdF (DUF218 family)